MRKMVAIMLLVLPVLVLSGGDLRAENYLDGPESFSFDSANDRYFLTSVRNGNLLTVDSLENQTQFAVLPNIRSTAIAGDTLYVSTTTRIYAYDLTTDTELWYVFDGYWNLDGLVCDTSGYLYAVHTGGRLIRFDRFNKTYTTFVTGLTPGVQDVTFDNRQNRLLLCTFADNHPIQQVSLPDGTLSVAITNNLGSFDGITFGNHGDVFASTFLGTGMVVRWDSTFSGPPTIIHSGLGQPSGLDYNRRDDIIAVPSFSGDSVELINLNFPKLVLAGYTAGDDRDDGDSVIEAGEGGLIGINLRNDLADATSVQAELVSTDPLVTVLSGVQEIAAVPGWGRSTADAAMFEVQVSPDVPAYHIALLVLNASWGSSTLTDTIYLYTGKSAGFNDDAESGWGYWTDQSISGTGQWHLEHYRYHSAETSWKMGGILMSGYANSADARLVTPPVRLSANSELRFWHYIDAEDDVEQQAWDGGIVMISTGDGNWEQIHPIGGYPYSTVDNPASPFSAGTPCYSGTHDWSEAVFDLSAYEGVYYLMFRFGSDAAANAEGWYVDDIVIEGDPVTCCIGMTGNINSDIDEVVDIGDLTGLIGYLFIPPYVAPECMVEANVNGDSEGTVDIGDLTALIAYLFIPPYPPLTTCP